MMAFFEQGWGKFKFGENFLKREGLTLNVNQLINRCVYTSFGEHPHQAAAITYWNIHQLKMKLNLKKK